MYVKLLKYVEFKAVMSRGTYFTQVKTGSLNILLFIIFFKFQVCLIVEGNRFISTKARSVLEEQYKETVCFVLFRLEY